MPEALRNNVLRALELYAEGGTIKLAREKLALSGRDFYQTLREEPEMMALYHNIQRDRADMMVDEAYDISTDPDVAPQAAREKSAIRIRIAQLYDRKRFGDKIDLNVNTTVDITAALLEAKTRALQPVCDLAQLPSGEYGAKPQLLTLYATDKQTVGPAGNPPAPSFDDVFGD